MERGIVLSARDQLKLDLIGKVESQTMDRETASMILNVSARTLKRYIKSYREKGVRSVLHANRGKSPANKKPDQLKSLAQQLVKECYYDFNMLHALEKINQDLDTEIKREVFRKWCHEIKIVKRTRRRRVKVRKYRQRMRQKGVMLLMDGSYHRWFGGLETCLIAIVDDATSEVLYAEFTHGETTNACLSILLAVVKKYGIFQILYTDKAGVFGGNKRSGFSQVERALGELGINTIYAHSPEAKGRIERLFDTLQDRLVPEMRLAGIKNMRQANKFLQENYLPHLHNPKFSTKPESPITAFKEVHHSIQLEEVFCKKEYRKVGKDHTISFDNRRYMLDQRFEYSISGQRIEIRIYGNGKWFAYYGISKMKLIQIKKVENILTKSVA